MKELQDLILLIKSRFPILLIESHEEPRVLSLLERTTNLENTPLFTWSVTAGLRRRLRPDAVPESSDLTMALRHIDKTVQNGVYVLLDAHPYLQDPVNLRLVREIALGYNKTARTLVFVSPRLELPQELMRVSARFKLKVLDPAGVMQIVREEAELWRSESGSDDALKGRREAVDLIAQHLSGMSADDARRLIRQAIRDDNRLNLDDVQRILKFKHESMAADSLLTLELDCGSFADVGGQQNLKRWLERRRAVFVAEPGTTGLDAPKGILLLGVQGSGKSLASKAVAGVWGVPLLRLDFASIYDKYFGETERNLRDALAAAEAMAPCVLWVDEIEKGLATDDTGGSDGGLSKRVLGTLLTWMSERKKRVFLVATANDISRLPPELVRKGRFDEIFFVDLPDAQTRKEIFRIHLARRKAAPDGFELEVLAGHSEGFSGAEIEQAVVSALYEAHATSVTLTNELMVEELRRTRPLSITMGERVEALRGWAAERTVPAN
jgi:SpoVK/Ycf46/Vps4 family AAA+-type ATPase